MSLDDLSKRINELVQSVIGSYDEKISAAFQAVYDAGADPLTLDLPDFVPHIESLPDDGGPSLKFRATLKTTGRIVRYTLSREEFEMLKAGNKPKWKRELAEEWATCPEGHAIYAFDGLDRTSSPELPCQQCEPDAPAPPGWVLTRMLVGSIFVKAWIRRK